jgi:cytochrome oxidase Cu insertion factor (SCO1/SenC/PrrC family)
MIRKSTFLIALAVLAALASSAAAQSAEREPESIDSMWLGQQVSGARVTQEDLEGRVVLAYHWCVS